MQDSPRPRGGGGCAADDRLSVAGLRWTFRRTGGAQELPSADGPVEELPTMLYDPEWHHADDHNGFCQQTWHARCYRINRNRLQADQPICFARAAEIRSEAISLVERQMTGDGGRTTPTGAQSGAVAASHFRSVWSP